MAGWTVRSAADQELIAAFEEAGQGHVFRFLPELAADKARALLDQAGDIDLEEVAALPTATAEAPAHRTIDPPGPELVRFETSDDYRRLRNSARERGIEDLRSGRVAVVVAAGGQGTRLGSTAPKGMWPVGPASGKPLLQWNAEKVLYWGRKLGRPIPFVIMVSDATAQPTLDFLRWHDYFGLDPTWVRLPCQSALPPVDDDGKFLLTTPWSIAMAPNGHGGVYRALRDSKVLDLLHDHGVDKLSYVQVDNPLILPIDPVFLGFHTRSESLISSKAVKKHDPNEKVGVFAQVDGRSTVVEYTELTEGQANQANPDGTLTYGHGSIAAHCIDLSFARRIAEEGLPVHCARKVVPHIDERGDPVQPTEPNATKFEMFLFDAIPRAERSLVLETPREDEFSPIKNATGKDSPATARRDMEALFRRWREHADLPQREGAQEISPLEAPTEFEFRLLHGLSPDR